MMTEKEFHEGAAPIFEVLNKLSLDDLQTLTRRFDCHPGSSMYYNEEDKWKKDECIRELVRKFGELRLGAAAAQRMNEGFRMLGLK